MFVQLKEIKWDNLIIVASVFMTILMMILTYSISLGIAWGFVIYAVASVASGNGKELGIGIWLMVIVFVIYLFFGL
jgi:AGZA family xanthine/uracil permease-like MFS transporter